MIEQKQIDRINQLAAKAKNEGLTNEEIKERDKLRKEYIESIRKNVREHLSRIKFVEDIDKASDDK